MRFIFALSFVLFLASACQHKPKSDVPTDASVVQPPLEREPETATKLLPNLDMLGTQLTTHGDNLLFAVNPKTGDVLFSSRHRIAHDYSQLYAHASNGTDMNERRITFSDASVGYAQWIGPDRVVYTSATDRLKERPHLFWGDLPAPLNRANDIYDSKIGLLEIRRWTNAETYYHHLQSIWNEQTDHWLLSYLKDSDTGSSLMVETLGEQNEGGSKAKVSKPPAKDLAGVLMTLKTYYWFDGEGTPAIYKWTQKSKAPEVLPIAVPMAMADLQIISDGLKDQDLPTMSAVNMVGGNYHVLYFSPEKKCWISLLQSPVPIRAARWSKPDEAWIMQVGLYDGKVENGQLFRKSMDLNDVVSHSGCSY